MACHCCFSMPSFSYEQIRSLLSYVHGICLVFCKLQERTYPLGKRTFVQSKCQTYIALSSTNTATFIFQSPYACVLFTSVLSPPLPSYPKAIFLCPHLLHYLYEMSRIFYAKLLGPSVNPCVYKDKLPLTRLLLMTGDF